MQKQAAVVQIDRPDGRDLVVGDEALCMYKAGRVLVDLDAALSNSPLRRRCVPRLNRLSRWSSSVFGSVIVLPQYSHVPKVLSAEISIFPPHILHLIISIFSSFFLRQLGSLIFVQSETSH